VKRVLLDGDLILRGLRDEGEFHSHFIELWNALQSAKLEGYITSADFDHLRQRLIRDVGSESSDPLLVAIRRIIRLWSADGASDTKPAIDAIITEDQQRFNGANTPTFSVVEFLQRYELDTLLEKTPDAQFTGLDRSSESPRKLNKALTTALLLLPILAELWLHKTQLNAIFAVAPDASTDGTGEPVASAEKTSASVEPVSTVERSVNHSSTLSSPAGAALLLSTLSGLDIQVENDIPLDVRLDASGRAVIVRLFVPGDAASAQGDAIAAMIQSLANDGSTPKVFILQDGTFVAAPAAGDIEPSALTEPNLDGQLVAMVQQSEDGQLTALLHSLTSQPEADAGDRSVQSSGQPQNTSVLTVRYVDQRSGALSAAPQSPIEIRLELSRNGSHAVTVRSRPDVSSPTKNGVQVPSGRQDGGNARPNMSPGEFFSPGGDQVEIWREEPIEAPRSPDFGWPNNGGFGNGGFGTEGGDRVEDLPIPPNGTVVQAVFPSSTTQLSIAQLNKVQPIDLYDELLGVIQGQPLLNAEVIAHLHTEQYEVLISYGIQPPATVVRPEQDMNLPTKLEFRSTDIVNTAGSALSKPETSFSFTGMPTALDISTPVALA
jgi:hypothetical protein